MTINELRVNLDLNIGNPMSILIKANAKSILIKANAKERSIGYLFVDSDDGYCYLFDKNGKEKDISELTAIDNELFYDDKSLTKIALPNSVKSIGKWAFSGCIRLTSIAISNSIMSIKNGAFAYCSSLTSVTIPDSVTNIGYAVFKDCSNLTSLVFKGKTKDEVKKMDSYPFEIKDESIIKYEAQG